MLVLRTMRITEAPRPRLVPEWELYGSGSRKNIKFVVQQTWDFRLLMAIFGEDVVCVDGLEKISSVATENEMFSCELPDQAEDLQVRLAINGTDGRMTVLSNALTIVQDHLARLRSMSANQTADSSTDALSFALLSPFEIFYGAIDYQASGVNIEMEVHDARAGEVKGCLLSAARFPLSTLKATKESDSLISCRLGPQLLSRLSSSQVTLLNISLYATDIPETTPAQLSVPVHARRPISISTLAPATLIVPSAQSGGHKLPLRVYGDFRTLVEYDLASPAGFSEIQVRLWPDEETAAITVQEVRPNFLQASIAAHTLIGVGEERGVEVVLSDGHGRSLVLAKAGGLRLEQGYTVVDWRPRQLTQERGSKLELIPIEL